MALKLIYVVAAVILLWIGIYMIFNIYQVLGEYSKVAIILSEEKEKVVLLRREISRLQKLNDEKSKKFNQKKKEFIRVSENKDNMTFEILRRRISNQIREMWFHISSVKKQLEKKISKTDLEEFSRYFDNFGELQRITAKDFEDLLKLVNLEEIRGQTANELSAVIQKRLHKLQHPEDCKTAKKLLCTLQNSCGYGCQVHEVLFCFMTAYATKRTLIINSNSRSYFIRNWNAHFEDISSSCNSYENPQQWSHSHDKYKVVELQNVNTINPRLKIMPIAIPRDLYNPIMSFHGKPSVWWVSQFTKYLLRLKAHLKEEIQKKKKGLDFKSPVVGVHVRRTDKIQHEAAYHPIEKYMNYVDLYYKKLELSKKLYEKRVFLATDDPTLLEEAKKKYPNYIFISMSGGEYSQERNTEKSVHGIINDVELLSDTDFLVCTFSSNVCRLAYEIMNHKHTDASESFQSLDDIYYFSGQQEHRVRAIWPHKAAGKDEVDLARDDIIHIAGNHWNGQSKGFHYGAEKTGLFPSYKVEDLHDIADFPNYRDD